MSASQKSPFLVGAYVVPERMHERSGFPLTLPFVAALDVTFSTHVTVLVGENGSGKSTLLEALAELVGLPWDGGSGNEIADSEKTEETRLASFLRPRIRQRPKDKYFFRAEALADFGRLLDQRERDPDFWGNPYALYGGRSIRTRSHGEAVAALLRSRQRGGLYLLDEPEAALSPLRQVALAELIEEQSSSGKFQFIIATHSPILMSIRDARLIDMNRADLPETQRDSTVHWRVFRRLIETGNLPREPADSSER